MARLSTMPPMVGALAPRTAAAPKRADPFYLSPEWRAARDVCLALHGMRCKHCGKRPRILFVDHIIELKDGGAPLDQSNLEPLCGSCHTRKTGITRTARHRGDIRPAAGVPDPMGGGSFTLA